MSDQEKERIQKLISSLRQPKHSPLVRFSDEPGWQTALLAGKALTIFGVIYAIYAVAMEIGLWR